MKLTVVASVLAAILHAGFSYSCDLSEVQLSSEDIEAFNDHESDLPFLTGAAISTFSPFEESHKHKAALWQFLHVICGNKALAALPLALEGAYSRYNEFKPLFDYVKNHPEKNISIEEYESLDIKTNTQGTSIVVFNHSIPTINAAARFLISKKSNPLYTSGPNEEIYALGLIYGYAPHLIERYLYDSPRFKSVPENLKDEKMKTVVALVPGCLKLITQSEVEGSFFRSGLSKFRPK